VGYSVSSLTTFPSIRYAAARRRRDADRNQPRSPEAAFTQHRIAVGRLQRAVHRSVDDCTFWYTQEYYTAASQATSTVGWLTRSAASVRRVLAGRARYLDRMVTSAATGNPIAAP